MVRYSAFLGAAVALHRPDVMLLAAMPAILFWLIDALHKSFQRRFIMRGREIEGYLSSGEFDRALTEQSFGGFISPRLSRGFGEGTFLDRMHVVLNAARLPQRRHDLCVSSLLLPAFLRCSPFSLKEGGVQNSKKSIFAATFAAKSAQHYFRLAAN